MLTWKFQLSSSSSPRVAGCVLCLCLGFASPAVAQEEASSAGAEAAEAAAQPPQAAPDEAAPGEEAASTDAAAEDAAAGETAPTEPVDERARALKEFQEAYKHYSAQMKDYKATVDSIVEAEYNRRIAQVNASYEGKISALEAVERQRRLDAIAAFEEYLRRYPNTPGYTPDALFRLAELHFEKANADYLAADEAYQDQMQAYQAGQVADPPALPVRDYSKTAALFQKLVADWPQYEQVDGALYLLAYCKLQMNDDAVARDLLVSLVENHPESRFVPEAWVRIGEYWFSYSESPEDLHKARHAYQQAMKFEDSEFYDKALYKLAWTYYRLDAFDKAIKEFKRLVKYSDDQKAKTGRSGSVLRAEAVQYIAVSLAEQDWDLDGAVDYDFGLPRVKKYLSGDEPYEREVLVQLVDYMFENTRYAIAGNIINYTLEKYPRNQQNPKLHEKLILALVREGRPAAAFAERGNLLAYYGPESDWYAYQKRVGREESLRYANNLVRDNLIQSATWFHEQAQNLKNEAIVRQDAEMLAVARQKYTRAAAAYEDFLARYPNDKDVYQWNFYYAECLYYSGQYRPAYEQYKVVRELDLSNNIYQEKAAYNAIKSLEFELRKRVESGEILAKALPASAANDAREAAQQQASQPAADGSDGQVVKIEPEPIPAMVMQYVTSMDRYVVLGLENSSDPDLDIKFAFQAGKLFYDYKNYDVARERFAWIVDNYPENELAYLSGSLILETYRQEKDYQNLAMWAERLSNVIKGEQAQAIRAEVRQFKLGAMFKSAEQLFQAKKYNEAAAEYLRLVNNAPEHQYASKALNNAAVAYENVGKYESAMKLFERVYKEYPDSPLAGYALYRVAVNSDRFFDFDKAVQSYMLFYDKYEGENPQMLQDMGFDVAERRQTALRSAAVLSENLQRYEEAARLYEQYVRAYPAAEDAQDAQWQAVQSWKKAGDADEMMDAIATHRREYGARADQSVRVLEGMMMIADHHAETGNHRKALRWYEDIIEEYQTRGIAKGQPGSYFGAKARFLLAEEEFQEWKEIEIKGSMKQQGRLLKKKIAEQKGVAAAFQEVFNYGSLEWTLAAFFRTGSIYEAFAQSLYNVPIPFEQGSEKWLIYRTQLDDMVIPLEDKAIEYYEGTIRKAREEKVVNKWTKRTLEQLNKYMPDKYPLYKEERREIAQRTRTGVSFIGVGDYQRRQAEPVPTSTESDAPTSDSQGEQP
jgi:TolA-binding protein